MPRLERMGCDVRYREFDGPTPYPKTSRARCWGGSLRNRRNGARPPRANGKAEAPKKGPRLDGGLPKLGA
ncbi:MAG: hypothetical protein M3N18_13020 [Actinomycetota bacterium]|nr:hypothetical protein [Actinomycetota bacterium]